MMGAVTCNFAAGTLAQTDFPKPDAKGDYYSNEAPLLGMSVSRLSPGSLWQVTTIGLSCRRQPRVSAPIVRQYKRGDVLQVEVYRGGSDEVLLNAKDANGKPWMPVRGRNLDDRCYVRANSRYIRPATVRSQGTKFRSAL